MGILAENMMQIDWRPEIGDPTIIGWLTVVAYLVAGVLAAICFRRAGNEPRAILRRQDRLFWATIMTFMFAMAINKQLDIQSLLTEIGKGISRSQGWYDDRRIVQLAFVILIALIGGAAMLVLARQMRNRLREFTIVLGGMGCLVMFIIIRASSFHAIDRFIDFDIAGIRMNWILELGGIGIIVLGTLLHLRDREAPIRREQERIRLLSAEHSGTQT